ncbi:LAQU0S10e02212g1_1 [Lachancea quebecensis]|uniref:LAQU0S10e02212g1_1 n=1 Tax=Lachancea quebecensis TaxID=1654605 RepID=A0A0P1KW74_9SACH|nr:LAQU0S10e02212g1_1 [Lachancea quebecensis]
MRSILQVPGPVKAFFDQFPLQTYPAVSKKDEASLCEYNARSYAFREQKALQRSVNDIFKLGVYNVYEDPESGCVLATDPWCLYAQLSLCKKNGLKLARKKEAPSRQQQKQQQKQQPALLVVSRLAASDKSLPILIEGCSKRNVRSTTGINEILGSRLRDAEELMYVSLLDSVVYDCWTTQALCELSVARFLQLYDGTSTDFAALQGPLYQTIREDLLERNDFSLRHLEISRHVRYMHLYQSKNAHQLTSPLFDSCKAALDRFAELLGSRTLFSNDSEPSYLDLKLASYVLCFLSLDDQESSLARYLRHEGCTLTTHARAVIAHFE